MNCNPWMGGTEGEGVSCRNLSQSTGGGALRGRASRLRHPLGPQGSQQGTKNPMQIKIHTGTDCSRPRPYPQFRLPL
jgi:hypothetical protein